MNSYLHGQFTERGMKIKRLWRYGPQELVAPLIEAEMTIGHLNVINVGSTYTHKELKVLEL